ncbi:MAG: HAD family hydrolase, partial [Rhodoferax sp.]
INTRRMEAAAQEILTRVPGARRTVDQGGRDTDIAFDYNERIRLPAPAVAQLESLLQGAGMHTAVSSIHVHGCYGNFDKWQGAQWIVRRLWGRDLTDELGHWVFVGDSGNDQAMFAHFKHSVGVANIRRFAATLTHLPRYITPSERGAGFAEVARSILAAR